MGATVIHPVSRIVIGGMIAAAQSTTVKATSLYGRRRLSFAGRTASPDRAVSDGSMSPNDPSARPAPADLAQSIVAVAQHRDRTAFGELFEYFGPRLKTYFIRAGLTAALAEELAQETMINVWRKAEQFDPARAGASTWIFVIARNLRIDHLRRLRSERAVLDDPSAAFEPAEAPALADSAVETDERERRVRAALAQLSAEQATVVRLSFFSDTPHGEIAAQLGIPLGTVKSRIRLAMARLRELLGEES